MNAQIVASSGTQTQATDPLLNVIRRSIGLLWSNGYNPDVLLLLPSTAETLDLLTSGGTAGWPGPYTFGAGQFGPPTSFGLQRRISKNLTVPVVVDSSAYGRLYAGTVSLQRFEENAGASNSCSGSRATRCSMLSDPPQLRLLQALAYTAELNIELNQFDRARALAEELRSYNPDVAARYVLQTLALHKEVLGLSDADLDAYFEHLEPDRTQANVSRLIMAADFERLADLMAVRGNIQLGGPGALASRQATPRQRSARSRAG